MFLHSLFRPALGGRSGFGLFLIRFVFGLGLFLHGLQKVGHLTSWMPPTSGFPPWLLAIAGIVELAGGLAMLFGFLTPLACILIAGEMLIAILKVHLPAGDPFVGAGESYEPAAQYAIVALGILFTGPGVISLDYLLFRTKLVKDQ